ncbi:MULTISPECIES: hypothetical protein [unclassified Chryseobacterium]|uniref:hypothetical protein n=1 Tax=unclassified Chryseobacterium TaxID=2593645 RepID=UPI000D3A5E79|nr:MULTISPECIES: hypothetical protein [unclassified Chryseobacterium]
MNSSDSTETNQREYKSLHEYLDTVFAGQNPSHEEIIREKKKYWRRYNTLLKQQQRRKYKNYTISLTTDESRELKKRIAKKQSVTEYIRELVKTDLRTGTQVNESWSEHDIRKEQQLFMIADYLEKLVLGSYITDHKSITELKSHLQKLWKIVG